MYTRKFIVMTYKEFENLVIAYVKHDYDFVAYEEVNNDSVHMYTGVKSKYRRELSNSLPNYNAYNLLCHLVKKGVIKGGDYLITVSW